MVETTAWVESAVPVGATISVETIAVGEETAPPVSTAVAVGVNPAALVDRPPQADNTHTQRTIKMFLPMAFFIGSLAATPR